MSLMVEPIGRQVYVLSSLRVRINLDLSYKIDGKEGEFRLKTNIYVELKKIRPWKGTLTNEKTNATNHNKINPFDYLLDSREHDFNHFYLLFLS